MTTLSLDCGSQDKWLSKSTMKSGVESTLFPKGTERDRECEIRQYLERRFDAEQIAHKMNIARHVVDKYLSTLRSST